MRYLLLLAIIFLCCTTNAQDSLAKKFPFDSGYMRSFDGTKIYYEVRGSGKPVLLIHGFIVNSNSWKHAPLYADLLNAGYKVITMDLRGNGRSDKPHDSTAYLNDAEAKDLMQLVTTLGIKHYAAVGYSRGSIITARLLVLDKRVDAAVMGGMGTDFTNPQWPRRLMFYHAFLGEDEPDAKGAVDYAKSQHLDLLALAYMQEGQPSTPKEDLQKVKQPVLVISGSEDTDNGSAPDLYKLFKNADRSVVPGDHNHASGTKEFSAAVLVFLKTHKY